MDPKDKSKREFDQFIDSGECAEAVKSILAVVTMMFPDDIRKQGVAIAAANAYFYDKYGPKDAVPAGTSKH